MKPRYEVIEHPSDVGFDLRSPSRERLMADATLVYYDMLVGLDRIEAGEERVVEVSGSDDPDLLVALLSQCLYMTEVDQLVFAEADVESLRDHRIRLVMRGERIDPERHPFDLGIKAITYHDLHVEACPDGTWHARVVFDI
jgi:SHS2 domain-containing protein